MITLRLEKPQAALRQLITSPRMPPPPRVKLQLLDYQLAALFVLASQYDRKGAHILEIGTGHGGSGYMLSRAAPQASITSLTTSAAEAECARKFWHSQGCVNIKCRVASSWDLVESDRTRYAMIFVDGDHNRIERDLPWFDHLADDGLFICHDYSPHDARSPSAIVFESLNRMAERLGRRFDVRIVDEHKIGMAGFYRAAPDPEQPKAPRQDPKAGIVLRNGAPGVGERAGRAGLGLNVGTCWSLPWPRVAFVSEAAKIPWDLLGFAFSRVLDRWDVAAPVSGATIDDIADGIDRDIAEGLWGDLRVPAYSSDIVLARSSDAGQDFVASWADHVDAKVPADLALSLALAEVKPLFCPLPHAWLLPESTRRAADAKAASGKLVRTAEVARVQAATVGVGAQTTRADRERKRERAKRGARERRRRR